MTQYCLKIYQKKKKHSYFFDCIAKVLRGSMDEQPVIKEESITSRLQAWIQSGKLLRFVLRLSFLYFLVLLCSYPLAFLNAIPAATAKQQQAQEERPLHPGQVYINLVEGFCFYQISWIDSTPGPPGVPRPPHPADFPWHLGKNFKIILFRKC